MTVAAPTPRPRRSRRGRLVVAGAGLLGAIAALRVLAGPPAPPPPPPVPPPSITAFTADGVTITPATRDRPGVPDGLRFVTAGADTTVLRWDPVRSATGYDLTWSTPGGRQHRALVAEPAVALTGVSARAALTLSLAAVDALGGRSEPVRLLAGVRAVDPDPGPRFTMQDSFVTAAAPDRVRWRLPDPTPPCLHRSGGDERGALLLTPGCAPGRDTVTLRAAAAVVPATPDDTAPDDVAGDGTVARLQVVADGPAAGVDLVVALLPGSHADLPPGVVEATGVRPGAVMSVPQLPPGALLLRVSVDGPALFTGTVRGPGPVQARAGTESAAPGVPVAWELRVSPGRTIITRDGVPVLSALVRSPWTTATAVVGAVRTTGPDAVVRPLRLEAVRSTGVPSSSTGVRAMSVTDVAADAGPAGIDTEGVDSVRVLGTLDGPGPAAIEFGTGAAPLLAVGPTTPGGPTTAVLAEWPGPLPPTVALRLVDAAPGTILRGVVVETTRRPGPARTAPPPRLPVADRVAPAVGPIVLDAAAQPDGTVAVTVSVGAGEVGSVGVILALDGRDVARLRTDRDGPALAGVHRFTIDPTLLTGPVPREITARSVPADRAAQPADARVAWPAP